MNNKSKVCNDAISLEKQNWVVSETKMMFKQTQRRRKKNTQWQQ